MFFCSIIPSTTSLFHQDDGAFGEGDESSSKKVKGVDGATASTAAPPSPVAVALALKDLLTHLLRELEKRDVNQVRLAAH